MNLKKQWDKFHITKNNSEIQEDMNQIVNIFKKRGVKKVLDLACGAGKHIIYLAKHGLEAYGIDISAEGTKIAKNQLKKNNLQANIRVGTIFNRLPYQNNFFDAIICTRSINHGNIKDIRKAIKEIERILKPTGLIFITVRKRVSKKFRHPFKEIASHTYVPLNSQEKGIIHYFFIKDSLKKEFKSFKTKIWTDKDRNYYCLFGEFKK